MLYKLDKCIFQELFFDFLFPATKALHQNEKVLSSSQPVFEKSRNIKPICDQLLTQNAAFQLIIALSERSFDNFKFLAQILMDSFYTRNVTSITEWEFQPPIGCKAPGGFVGLKNAGATCYMNSVIQQLFMVPEIREGILSIPGIADDYSDNDMAIDFRYYFQSISLGSSTNRLVVLAMTFESCANIGFKRVERIPPLLSSDKLPLNSFARNSISCILNFTHF